MVRTAARPSPSPESFLPLTDVALQILMSLVDGDRHGYGVLLEVERRTSGRVKLRPGTLYRAISRLTDQALTVPVACPPDEDDRRQCYRLTPLGREVVRAELERLSSVLASTQAKVLLSEGR